ncbi:MAG: tRNA (adenosine(37)-N6)-dimethylallyltransferase MiaA [Actinobacteria bacterium]|nr:tRNA (adenosine(37)-N6)-dimethylallyltransferase MiaA [Actinomycetota bacterium]MCI0543181.1 tRNA (adenosine(37)-N6)-dimethylallyltransferase MiaA [Actinomycetota bacterium]
MRVAEMMGAEVVSVDSMQVYRGLDVGTAKPTVIERRGIPHHLIDVAEPSQDFTVADYARMGREIIEQADTPLVISGGSGLHFRSLVDPMSFAPTDDHLRANLESKELGSLGGELERADPEARRHVDLANKRRVVRALEIWHLTGETPTQRAASAEAEDLRRYVSRYPFSAVGLDPGGLLEARVDIRLAEMRSGGLPVEVSKMWPLMGRNARTAVGYGEIAKYLDGVVDLETAFANAARATKRLARKQRTWFQRDPRIRWIPWLESEEERLLRVMETLK